jgi:phenylacetaldehyde dehydrogenase
MEPLDTDPLAETMEMVSRITCDETKLLYSAKTSLMDSAVTAYLARYNVPAEVISFIEQPVGNFIDGKTIVTAEGWLDIFEPYTGALLTRLTSSGANEVDVAVRSSRKALAGPWAKLSPLERQGLVLKLAEAVEEDGEFLAQLESIGVGKSVSEARTLDIAGSIANLQYFAGWASKLDGRTAATVGLAGRPFAFTVKEPVGVVAAIIPWNFPLQTFVWKLAAALATGCTVICKPSELTPLSAMRLAQLATNVGFPDGVVNVVNGPGHIVGQALASHPGIDKLSFTGSTPVGTAVGKTALDTMKRLTLELGGKSPVIVTANADLDRAVDAILAGIFTNSGQVCDAGSRVYADAAIHESLLAKLKRSAEKMPVGPGLDPQSRITPVVSRTHRARVMEHIQSAHREGATLLTGEQSVEGSRDDQILLPTIFYSCTEQMGVFREEIFGPVLGIASFDDLDEAVARANSSIYGLAAAVYSNDINEVFRLSRELKAGNVYVNAHGLVDPTMPFGGLRASGFGKDMGPEQLDSFLSTKSVYVRLGTND